MWRAAFLAIVLMATGCATSDGGESSRTTRETKPCRSGTAAPVDEAALKRALAGRGIQLYRDDNCAPGALAALSNTAVPYERQEAVISSEGDIHCDLYPEDAFGARLERFVWRNDREPTYARVLNVDCAIYPQRLANTDSLERGLRRLPGVSALPAKVPSSDAMPDALARSDR